MIANNQNLKNFIRHGKQAAVQSPDAVVVDQKLEVHHKPNKEAYDQAVKQIIKEENEQRQRLPRYQGLKEDRFQLIEKIGDGAFSVVYRALDKKDGAQVAVKIIRKQDLSNSQVSEFSVWLVQDFFAKTQSHLGAKAKQNQATEVSLNTSEKDVLKWCWNAN